MKSSIKIIALVLAVFLTSCVKDIDFDQANELELTPSYVVSLVNFEIPQTTVVDDNGNEVITISDKSELTVLNTKEAQDYLEKLVLDIQIANTFNRSFVLTFKFLDANNAVTYPPIQMNVTAQDLAFSFKEEIVVANNPNFLKTRQIETILELQPSDDGSKIDTAQEDAFTFTSAATLFLRIN